MTAIKKIVILGATSTIAEHCARLWSKTSPCHFFLVARNQEKLQKIRQDLLVRSPESQVVCKSLNFFSSEEIANLANEIFSQAKIDIVLIAQGWLAEQGDCQTNIKLLQESMLLNAISPILCAEAFVSQLEKSGRGSLAVIGSVAGDRGRKSNYAYGAAKAFIAQYLQGLQHRFANSNINIVLIKPGPTDTAMTAHMQTSGLASVEVVARDIVSGIESGKPVIYTPAKWRWIMLIIKALPNFIFHKMNI